MCNLRHLLCVWLPLKAESPVNGNFWIKKDGVWCTNAWSVRWILRNLAPNCLLIRHIFQFMLLFVNFKSFGGKKFGSNDEKIILTIVSSPEVDISYYLQGVNIIHPFYGNITSNLVDTFGFLLSRLLTKYIVVIVYQIFLHVFCMIWFESGQPTFLGLFLVVKTFICSCYICWIINKKIVNNLF